MTNYVLLVFFVIAIACGWAMGRWQRRENFHTLSKEYLLGLNFLLEEKQPNDTLDQFLKALPVNAETLDIHLSLGGLFRRRGEVDKAIAIHQYILKHTTLNASQRFKTQFELGQNYMAAGLFDRAEVLFQELLSHKEYKAACLQALLQIYQQERDWERAEHIAKQLLFIGYDKVKPSFAHFCCEQAIKALKFGDIVLARRKLSQALEYDSKCVRASLMVAQIDYQAGYYKEAIEHLKQVPLQDADYVTETIIPLTQCYQQLDQEEDLLCYWHQCVEQYPAISVVIAAAEQLRKIKGDKEAANFIAEQLKRRPSVRGLSRLIDLHLQSTEGKAKENLAILQSLMQGLLDNKPVYRCTDCGFSGKAMHWLCPSCKHWGTVKPIHGLEGE